VHCELAVFEQNIVMHTAAVGSFLKTATWEQTLDIDCMEQKACNGFAVVHSG